MSCEREREGEGWERAKVPRKWKKWTNLLLNFCVGCVQYAKNTKKIAVLMFVMLMRERDERRIGKTGCSLSLSLLTIYAVPVHKEMHQLGVVVLYLVLKVF